MYEITIRAECGPQSGFVYMIDTYTLSSIDLCLNAINNFKSHQERTITSIEIKRMNLDDCKKSGDSNATI